MADGEQSTQVAGETPAIQESAESPLSPSQEDQEEPEGPRLDETGSLSELPDQVDANHGNRQTEDGECSQQVDEEGHEKAEMVPAEVSEVREGLTDTQGDREVLHGDRDEPRSVPGGPSSDIPGPNHETREKEVVTKRPVGRPRRAAPEKMKAPPPPQRQSRRLRNQPAADGVSTSSRVAAEDILSSSEVAAASDKYRTKKGRFVVSRMKQQNQRTDRHKAAEKANNHPPRRSQRHRKAPNRL